MKTFNRFIIERLRLNDQSKINLHKKFHPKNFDELQNLIKQLLEERGPNADMNDIDISSVTSFWNEDTRWGLFENLDPHNIDISKWDVSNVTSMRHMFSNCCNFNCNLSQWNVRKVKDMNFMFNNCEKFDCNLSQWDVRNVEDMCYMFSCCINFKGQGLEKWKPIKCEDMYEMFDECESLKNKPNWYWE